jgi:hypothetical protein
MTAFPCDMNTAKQVQARSGSKIHIWQHPPFDTNGSSNKDHSSLAQASKEQERTLSTLTVQLKKTKFRSLRKTFIHLYVTISFLLSSLKQCIITYIRRSELLT